MSGITDYGNFGPQTPNQTTGTGSSQPSAPNQSPLSHSSIQQSELEILQLLFIAGIPILMPPEINGNSPNAPGVSGVDSASPASILMQIEQKKNEIISKMWDSYIKNIQEIAQRNKEEDIRRETVDATKPGPKSAVEYFTYLLSLFPIARMDEVGGAGAQGTFNNTYHAWMVNPVDSGSSINGLANGYPSSSFTAGCMACNPDAIRNAIGADGAVLGIQLSSSPVADALFAVGPTSGLPGDYQAAAALIAALLNGGAVMKATADSVLTGGGAKPQYDLNFAVNYAKNIMAIVTKNIEGQGPTTPERTAQNTMIRLMLSAMALNMVYRSAYGGMQGKEFANLLEGNTADLPSEIRGFVEQLVSLVKAFLPRDPAAREETISRLMEYVDSKDSVDEMLRTSRVFSGALNQSDLNANRLGSVKT